MLIRIKQIRAGGTQVVMGKDHAREYHFKPADPRKPGENHVCDVTNSDDIATLLAIKEGYEVHASEIASRAKPEDPANSPAPGGDDPALTKAALMDAVAKKTGKRPHPSTSVARLEAMLSA